jgi:hypothetical protein
MNGVSKVRSRRSLFVGVLRYTALGSLGATAGAAAIKRHRLVEQGKCVSDGLCRDCTVFRDCRLPRALQAKELIVRGGNGQR